MTTYNIVFSPTGGTGRVAEILCNALSEKVVTIPLPQKVAHSFTAEDLCVISMPSFGGQIPNVCVEWMANLNGNGARAVLVAVFGNRAIDDTLLEMKDVALMSGFRPIAAIEAVAEHSIARQFGAGRPDAQDAMDLYAFAQKIKNISVIHDVYVPGTKPYKAFAGSALKPAAGSRCTGCGLCVKACPVAAIPAGGRDPVDAEQCISCMRCISVCPEKARTVDPELLAAVTQKLEPVCSTRKENKLYL